MGKWNLANAFRISYSWQWFTLNIQVLYYTCRQCLYLFRPQSFPFTWDKNIWTVCHLGQIENEWTIFALVDFFHTSIMYCVRGHNCFALSWELILSWHKITSKVLNCYLFVIAIGVLVLCFTLKIAFNLTSCITQT